MLINLSVVSRTRNKTRWHLAYDNRIYTLTVARIRKHDLLTEARYVINRILKLNTSQYIYLGSIRTNGKWITEWYIHTEKRTEHA